VQRKLDATEAHADRSNWILKGMKSMFSFRGKEPPKPKEVVAARQEARGAMAEGGGGGGGGGGGSGGGGGGGRAATGGSGGGGGGAPDRAQQQAPRGAVARTEEDDLLDAISGSMTRVKAAARGIGDEIDRQDKTIDAISTGVERVDSKVQKATRDAKKLAK